MEIQEMMLKKDLKHQNMKLKDHDQKEKTKSNWIDEV